MVVGGVVEGVVVVEDAVKSVVVEGGVVVDVDVVAVAVVVVVVDERTIEESWAACVARAEARAVMFAACAATVDTSDEICACTSRPSKYTRWPAVALTCRLPCASWPICDSAAASAVAQHASSSSSRATVGMCTCTCVSACEALFTKSSRVCVSACKALFTIAAEPHGVYVCL